jgi:hypothetical protein
MSERLKTGDAHDPQRSPSAPECDESTVDPEVCKRMGENIVSKLAQEGLPPTSGKGFDQRLEARAKISQNVDSRRYAPFAEFKADHRLGPVHLGGEWEPELLRFVRWALPLFERFHAINDWELDESLANREVHRETILKLVGDAYPTLSRLTQYQLDIWYPHLSEFAKGAKGAWLPELDNMNRKAPR